jgi:4'-phosphopantetheinyl transferase
MASPVVLAPGEIHLWLSFYDEIADLGLHACYRDLLSVGEKEQQTRFYFARDRQRYLVTRVLVRTVLSRYASIRPTEWTFIANAYGRPEIGNAQAKDFNLSFNVSHTHHLIVLAVTEQRALGVDVENIIARGASIDIADRLFAPAEVVALAAVPHHQQQYRFFEYWTLKEAYIKARGLGLSLPLDKFSFHYPKDGAVALTIHPELADDAARWQFWQFRPKPKYLVAVCAERAGTRTSGLVVRTVVPGVYEELFAPVFLHTSE